MNPYFLTGKDGTPLLFQVIKKKSMVAQHRYSIVSLKRNKLSSRLQNLVKDPCSSDWPVHERPNKVVFELLTTVKEASNLNRVKYVDTDIVKGELEPDELERQYSALLLFMIHCLNRCKPNHYAGMVLARSLKELKPER